MKKQIKPSWRAITFTAIVTLAVVLADPRPATAQTTYKVGDRVEKLSAGTWVEATITEVKDDGWYVIRFTESGVPGAWVDAKYLRPMASDARTTSSKRLDTPGAVPTKGNAPSERPATAQIGTASRFGARAPRTCDDTKAPEKGAITAPLALKYLNCQMEKISGGHLYLVENVKVEVGGGVPYDRTLGAFEAINVRVPLYPIRGSYLQYQCDDLISEHVGPPNTSCTTYNQPRATGYCYRTTFGDWKCQMSDSAFTNKENVRTGVAPPKS